jgi:hypothetical protein
LATVATDDHDLSFEEICDKYGYPLEKYTVTTDDGYILQTFRIPHGKGQTYSSSRPALLFQHGAFDSSDALFNHGPDLSPAFYLANQGYDVWVSIFTPIIAEQIWRPSNLFEFSSATEEETSTAETTLLWTQTVMEISSGLSHS